MMYAANPQDAGQLFKWNNSTAFERVTSGSGISSATLDVAWTLNHNASAAATTWQVANNPCPADWRVPTAAELTSLAGVVSTDNTLEGVTGRWFGSGDNRIFLPTTGERANNASGTFSQGTTHGYYWSASPRGTGTTLARGMVFQATGTPTIDPTTTSAAGRGLGRAVRCVR